MLYMWPDEEKSLCEHHTPESIEYLGKHGEDKY